MSTSRSVRSGKLEVPGASIYYEVRGSGPILLLIHGGGGDVDKFRLIADHLADAYTVLTYDRRGHSRSNPADRTEAYRVEIQATMEAGNTSDHKEFALRLHDVIANCQAREQ